MSSSTPASRYMSTDEIALLKELVNQYKDVIENKQTDAVNFLQKKRTWEALTKEFNAHTKGVPRTVDKLKKCWTNQKSKRKEELAREKRERMSTGGGPYKAPTEDVIDDVLENVNIEIRDTIDSDTVALAAMGNSENYELRDDTLIPTKHVEHHDIELETEAATYNEETPKFTRITTLQKELNCRLAKLEASKQNESQQHDLKLINMYFNVLYISDVTNVSLADAELDFLILILRMRMRKRI
nr:uncharacterized protein LOC111419298 [Onthophagus taurus]